MIIEKYKESWAEEDDFEYGGRSTRSVVKSVTLSDNHIPTIKFQ